MLFRSDRTTECWHHSPQNRHEHPPIRPRRTGEHCLPYSASTDTLDRTTSTDLVLRRLLCERLKTTVEVVDEQGEVLAAETFRYLGPGGA